LSTNHQLGEFPQLLRQAGVTLIELIVFIVIISIAIAGILGVMNLTTGHSADTLIRKQSAVIAESLLEEIELHDMIAASGTVATAVTAANRTNVYHTVSNYNGFSTAGGIKDISGSTTILGNYNFNPAVSVTAINAGELGAAVPAASAVRITVSVTDPTGNVTSLIGYRTAY